MKNKDTNTTKNVKENTFFYEGWKYNNEYNLSPEKVTVTYSKAEKPELTEIKLVDQEN